MHPTQSLFSFWRFWSLQYRHEKLLFALCLLLTGNRNTQTDVGCVEKVKMKDAVSIMSVPPSMLLDYSRVLDMKRALSDYLVSELLFFFADTWKSQIRKDTKPEIAKKQGKAVAEALSQAIIFSSRDDTPDPFKREGIPIPHRQSLLVQNLMHILVEVADIGPAQHTKITTLALKALKLMVRGTENAKKKVHRIPGSFKNSKRLYKLLHPPDFSGKKFPKDKAIKYYSRIPVSPTFIEMYQYVPYRIS